MCLASLQAPKEDIRTYLKSQDASQKETHKLADTRRKEDLSEVRSNLITTILKSF